MKFLQLLLIVFFVKSVNLNSQTSYKSANGFELSIPANWKQIPQKEVNEFATGISAKKGYEAGFYPVKRKSTEWGYPYVLLQFMKGDMDESKFEEYAEVFIKTVAMKKVQENIAKNYEGQIKHLKIGQAYYDKTSKRAIMKAESEIEGVGSVISITTVIFNKKGALFVNYYNKKSDFESSLSLYSSIVVSVKFK